LPRSGKPSPEFFFDNSPVVLFVELRIYNTVVLVSPEFTPVDNGWNTTIPKVIDNAILYAVESGKYK
jgi:hypothetical protein